MYKSKLYDELSTNVNKYGRSSDKRTKEGILTIGVCSQNLHPLDDYRQKNCREFVDRSTQTDTRESETQTLPWDPPYKLSEITKNQSDIPEVLLLKNFTYGQGIPATAAEVHHVLNLREINKVKNGSKLIDDGKKVIEVKYASEEGSLENELKYKEMIESQKQDLKLKHLRNALVNELEIHSKKKEQILKNKWSNRVDEREKKNLKLKENFQKRMEKIDIPDSIEKKPMTLDKDVKRINDKKSDFLLSKYYLSDAAALTTVKEWIEESPTSLKVEIPLPKSKYMTTQTKLVEQAYQDLLEKKRTKPHIKAYYEEFVKEEPPVISTSIPSEDLVEYLPPTQNKIDMVSVVQQTLRGLAYKKNMLQLIDKHKDELLPHLSQIYPDIFPNTSEN